MRYTSVVLLARTVGPHWPQILFHFGYQLPTPLGTSCHDGHLCSPLVGCDCLSVRDIGSSHRYWILTPYCTLSHAVSYTFFARTSPDTCSQCAGWQYSLSLCGKSAFSPDSPQHCPIVGSWSSTPCLCSLTLSSFLVQHRWHMLCCRTMPWWGAGSLPPVVCSIVSRWGLVLTAWSAAPSAIISQPTHAIAPPIARWASF